MGQVVAGGAEARPKGLMNLRPHMVTLRSTWSIGVWNLGRRGSVSMVMLCKDCKYLWMDQAANLPSATASTAVSAVPIKG